MRSTFSFSLLISSIYLASSLDTVYANYGRFPCGSPSGSSGEVVADQSKCVGKPFAGSDSQCVRIYKNEFACGVQGANCLSSIECDGGQCEGPYLSGVCTGGPGLMPGTGQKCLGKLRITNYDGTNVGSCGGTGAACAQRVLIIGGDGDPDIIQNRNPDNSLCQSNYCESSTGVCGARPSELGSPCTEDYNCPDGVACRAPSGASTVSMVCGGDGALCNGVDERCVSGYCNPSTRACSQQPVPSGRARQRRNQIALSKAQCPPQHEACSLVGYFGYECIDTMSNIERCGSCDGGDCTELPGVDCVHCSEGSCIILSCADGYQYDKINKTCISSKIE